MGGPAASYPSVQARSLAQHIKGPNATFAPVEHLERVSGSLVLYTQADEVIPEVALGLVRPAWRRANRSRSQRGH
jgi:hypothetical protein